MSLLSRLFHRMRYYHVAYLAVNKNNPEDTYQSSTFIETDKGIPGVKESIVNRYAKEDNVEIGSIAYTSITVFTKRQYKQLCLSSQENI